MGEKKGYCGIYTHAVLQPCILLYELIIIILLLAVLVTQPSLYLHKDKVNFN